MKMKRLNTLLLLMTTFSGTTIAAEPAAPSGRIEVSIADVRNCNGIVGVALFNTKKGFPDKTASAIEGRSVPAGNRCLVVFDNVPYGTYAVSVMHDENGNGKMDKGFLGIPKEGFGTSNNPKLRMGPPSFSDSKIDLNDRKLLLTINMKYLKEPAAQK